MFFKVLNILTSAFANVLAPRLCEVCNEYLGSKSRQLEFICDKCLDSIPLAPPPQDLINKLITFFPNDDLALSQVCALFSVSGKSDYMEIIHSLKYRGYKRAGVEFGELLGRMLIAHDFTDYDYLVPVPIHRARKRERGYNQSSKIAEGISRVLTIPIDEQIIVRAKYTMTQTMLNAEERKYNLSKAFSAGSKCVQAKGKKVLLIDDVLTTGSTLNTCANEILTFGARRVDAAVLASA